MDRVTKLIGKYAIILSALHLIQTSFDKYLDYLVATADALEYAYLRILPSILFNIFVAIMIYADKKRFDIQGRHVVLLTLLFHPIGVVLFLIYAINSARLKADKGGATL